MTKKNQNRQNHPASAVSKKKASTDLGAFSLVSLGCPKNLVDSESMTGRLIDAGLAFRPESNRVDLIVLNTCAFLQSARDEAFEQIDELVKRKQKGRLRFLVVCGCLVSRDCEDLVRRFPDVDAWISPFDEREIGPIVRQLFGEQIFSNAQKTLDAQKLGDVQKIGNTQEFCSQEKPSAENLIRKDTQASEETARKKGFLQDTWANQSGLLPIVAYQRQPKLTLEDTQRRLLTPAHVAYLKIADGCDRFCSYCSIPLIRGRFVSKPFSTLFDESRRLADQGVRELVLIAQETTFWGNDLYGEPRLDELLACLKDQGDFDWIRVLYTYPLFFSDALISLYGGKSSETAFDTKKRHWGPNDLALPLNGQVDEIEKTDKVSKMEGTRKNNSSEEDCETANIGKTAKNVNFNNPKVGLLSNRTVAGVARQRQTVVLPYIDLPLQHCNETLLKKMNRRVGKSQIEDLLAAFREKIPGVILRTSMIVGFPGETDAMFDELVTFMQRWKFERAGVFEFSPEAGTGAARMDDQVPAAVKSRRYRQLYQVQEKIAQTISRSWIGKTLDVLIDEHGVDENGRTLPDFYYGRTYADAPDIDPIVYVTGLGLNPGDLVSCEIVDVQGTDLIAVPCQ